MLHALQYPSDVLASLVNQQQNFVPPPLGQPTITDVTDCHDNHAGQSGQALHGNQQSNNGGGSDFSGHVQSDQMTTGSGQDSDKFDKSDFQNASLDQQNGSTDVNSGGDTTPHQECDQNKQFQQNQQQQLSQLESQLQIIQQQLENQQLQNHQQQTNQGQLNLQQQNHQQLADQQQDKSTMPLVFGQGSHVTGESKFGFENHLGDGDASGGGRDGEGPPLPLPQSTQGDTAGATGDVIGRDVTHLSQNAQTYAGVTASGINQNKMDNSTCQEQQGSLNFYELL